jgi:acetyltransferase-like isoleucine patch superfamily enzyme
VSAPPLLHSFARYLFRYRSVKGGWLAIKYPRVQIAKGANLDIDGAFHYDAGCSIGVGTNIIIPAGGRLCLGRGCYIGRYVELGPRGSIHIGDYTSVQDRSIFLGEVTIGRYCTIAPNVYISSGRHHFDLQPYALIKDQDRICIPNATVAANRGSAVVVEDDCWLGINAVLMPGIVVGKGAVVGANSVVTKDVSPYIVVAGSPARAIRQRLKFSPPKKISYADPLDWPYFYAGFEMSQRALDDYANQGGVATKGDFVLCLDGTQGNSIHIVSKAIGCSLPALTFGNQRKVLAAEFQELVFDIDGGARGATRHHMSAEPSTATLVVKEAWIQ